VNDIREILSVDLWNINNPTEHSMGKVKNQCALNSAECLTP
jgi:hypothetical protein